MSTSEYMYVYLYKPGLGGVGRSPLPMAVPSTPVSFGFLGVGLDCMYAVGSLRDTFSSLEIHTYLIEKSKYQIILNSWGP